MSQNEEEMLKMIADLFLSFIYIYIC